jgi:hypothetical protein
MLRKRLNVLSGTTISHSEGALTSNKDKGKGKSAGHGQRGDLSSFPSVTERYSEPESGFGSSDEEDEEADEEQALDVDNEDEDEEVHDPYTDEEEDEEVLSDASGSRSSHTSRARSPDSLNSTASSRTARPRSAPYASSTSTDHIPHESESDARRPPRHQKRAWYELDTSILLALLAPVAIWLSGGDHLQNLVLLVVLVLYLHQLIEGLYISRVYVVVVWTLY